MYWRAQHNYYTYSVRAHTIRTIIPFENWKWKHGEKKMLKSSSFFSIEAMTFWKSDFIPDLTAFLACLVSAKHNNEIPVSSIFMCSELAVIQAPNWPLWFGTPYFAYTQGGSLWTLFSRALFGCFFFLFFFFGTWFFPLSLLQN